MVKSPTTYQLQMEILKSRHIIIEDEQFCLRVLEHLNYYRLTAYMLPYKLNDTEYMPIPFEKIYSIYEFDRKLRSLLLTVLEEIELLLRTKLSYYHSHTFGALGYLKATNYNKSHNHTNFISEFEKLLQKNREAPFVRHHVANRGGEFPMWVAVELFPFGMLSRFYADMPVKNKKEFAILNFNVGYKQLESWLLCLSTLRNRCAHYMRLYNLAFNKWPRATKNEQRTLSNTAYDYIYILQYCYLDTEKWKNSFLLSLETLVEEYQAHIELSRIGFPQNWKDELLKTCSKS